MKHGQQVARATRSGLKHNVTCCQPSAADSIYHVLTQHYDTAVNHRGLTAVMKKHTFNKH